MSVSRRSIIGSVSKAKILKSETTHEAPYRKAIYRKDGVSRLTRADVGCLGGTVLWKLPTEPRVDGAKHASHARSLYKHAREREQTRMIADGQPRRPRKGKPRLASLPLKHVAPERKLTLVLRLNPLPGGAA